MISDRRGGDTLAAKIAEEELALNVEKTGVTAENFKSQLIKIIADYEVDTCYFFTLGTHEPEHALSRPEQRIGRSSVAFHPQPTDPTAL